MNLKQQNNKFSRYSFLIIVFVSVLILSYAIKNPVVQEEKKVTYGEFLNMLDQKKIRDVAIAKHLGKVKGTDTSGKKFTVDAPEDQDLIKELRKNGVPFSAENPGMKENVMSFITVIIVPLAIILVLWFFIVRQAQMGGSQAMSFGRSKAKMMTDNMPPTTFDDVAGVDEAKQELQEIVDFLKDPQKFQTLGAKIPKGVLLVGPPGSGKTLLARAIAGEAKVPFFHMSGSDFVEMFVGVGASRVRDLFEQAKRHAPCLVFVDEIDAVGRQRGAGLGGGHDEREQTLNQLLVEMDGFDPNIGVILLAATNRPDVLDPALLRPGRFDRRVVVDRPDRKGRAAILRVHARGKPFAENVDLDIIAGRTPGFTGADLSNLLNEAAILAARANCDRISMPQVEEAIERVIAGPERKSRLLSDREKRNTAYHEAGHAIAAKMLPSADPVHKISILPRGLALGYTIQLPIEDKYSSTRAELLTEICVLLGGRTAEQLAFGDITTGSANDIERATRIARRMVCEFGMSDILGPINFGANSEVVFLGRDIGHEHDYSEQVAARIDEEIRRIIDDCQKKVETILSENRERLETITNILVEYETLDGDILGDLLGGKIPTDSDIAELDAIRKMKEEEYQKRLKNGSSPADAENNGDKAAAGDVSKGKKSNPLGDMTA